MKIYFDHEKLDVYWEAINFCAWVGKFLAAVSAKAEAKEQLDRASTSIPLNIAEGNGKFSPNDRARFFEIARGSALESAAGLDVLVAPGFATPKEIISAKETLVRIVRCSWDCSAGFRLTGTFSARMKHHILPRPITSTSRSTSTN